MVAVTSCRFDEGRTVSAAARATFRVLHEAVLVRFSHALIACVCCLSRLLHVSFRRSLKLSARQLLQHGAARIDRADGRSCITQCRRVRSVRARPTAGLYRKLER